MLSILALTLETESSSFYPSFAKGQVSKHLILYIIYKCIQNRVSLVCDILVHTLIISN